LQGGNLESKLKKEGKEVGGRAGTHRLLRLEHRSTVTLAAVSLESNDALSTLYISLSKKKTVLSSIQMTVSTHRSAGGAGVHITSTLSPNGHILFN
jgi:hypothetical protein